MNLIKNFFSHVAKLFFSFCVLCTTAFVVYEGYEIHKKFDVNYYDSLAKSTIFPKAAMFAPIWAVMYMLLLIAAVGVIYSKHKASSKAKVLFFWVVQFSLQLFWSVLFMLQHNLFASAIVLCFILFFALLTAGGCFKCNKILGLMLVPYVLWLSFALYLNIVLFNLNSNKVVETQADTILLEGKKNKHIKIQPEEKDQGLKDPSSIISFFKNNFSKNE